MTQISPAAAAAQNEARNHGKFGVQTKGDPGSNLLEADQGRLAEFAGWSNRGYDRYSLAELQKAMPAGWQIRSKGDSSELLARQGDNDWAPLSAEFNRYLANGHDGDPVPTRLLFTSPQPTFNNADRTYLADMAGAFKNGYTPDRISRFDYNTRGMTVGCVWSTYDENDFGGDSEIICRVNGDDPWRRLSDEGFHHLWEAEEGTPPPAHFLADEPSGYEINLDTILVMGPGRNYMLAGEEAS